VEPTTCTLGYDVVAPAAITSYVTVDAAARTLKVNIADTSLTSLAGDYSITINPKTSTGTAISGKTLTVSLKIVDRCEPVLAWSSGSTTVTSVTTATDSYTLGDAEKTITWPVRTPDPTRCVIDYNVVIPSTITSYVTVDKTARTLKVHVSDTTLTSLAGAYEITISPTSPSG